MSFLSSGFDIAIIILGFGLLIFVHELGHFLAAKWAGIRTEAFAIGMGHAILSWRKGVGFAVGSTHRKVVERTGKAPLELSDDELEQHGLGETEYSLRWLPIGGFVKMLGQEDLNPSAISADPRAYGRCPIGKRMIVVSAGVIMNLVTAAAMFVVAFMVGVKFEDAVVGDVHPALPAATAVATNAEVLGIDRPGILPGDRVLEIGGKKADRFAHLVIGTAMARPDVPIELVVERAGVAEPLRFMIEPEKDPGSGLLSIGIGAASSTVLRADDENGVLRGLLADIGLDGVEPSMRIVEANGRTITAFQQLNEVVDASDGQPLDTVWEHPETGEVVQAALPLMPLYQKLIYAESPGEGLPPNEQGLLGLTPLVRITGIPGKENRGILEADDVVLRVGAIEGPRVVDFMRELGRHKREQIPIVVLRDGERVTVEANVNSKGKLNVHIAEAWDLPVVARPMAAVRPSMAGDDRGSSIETAAASLNLFGGTRIDEIAGTAVTDWASIRAALRARTGAALAAGEGAEVEVAITNPTPGAEQERLPMRLSESDVRELHALGWRATLDPLMFEPVRVTRTAEGNPIRAIAMGIEETHTTLVLTYLTIDRLFRGSVGVEQLRGPLGIVDLGTKVIDSGAMYLIFFLAMISVNLAVINFLPIPIVDGGLFLFLVYEKLKGRPPSIAFQNAATIVGLFMIGTLLLVVTWNDVMRLIG